MAENTTAVGPIVHRIGDGAGRSILGDVSVSAFTAAKTKKSAARATLKFVGVFVEYEAGASTPTLAPDGTVRVSGTTTASAVEATAILRAWAVSSFVGAPDLAALADAAAAARTTGRGFVVRLPGVGAATMTAPTVLSLAAAYDPTL